jgi:leader peptidase (prepilin peptidase)/N-methyltransferase
MAIPFIEIPVFIFGICIGSFLNVCIYRIPESVSIVHPRSMCPNCGNPIIWYDNIPLLSYLTLKGRCRHCGQRISVRYLVVEALGGVMALLVLYNFGLSISALIHYVFLVSLIVVTYIDIDHKIIPDVITLPGIAIFFLCSFLLPLMDYKDSILGILSGGGCLFLVAWVYERIAKKEGMGGGDIKFLAMIGALIGWKGVLFTVFVASIVGTVIGISIMVITRKDMKLAVPFGPFLALGAFVYLFFGDDVIYWYVHLI